MENISLTSDISALEEKEQIHKILVRKKKKKKSKPQRIDILMNECQLAY